MKNVFLVLLLLFGTQVIVAQDSLASAEELFGEAETEFEFERFSEAGILLQVDRDAEVACDDGLCVLTAVTNKFGGFSVEFNVGEGNVIGGGSGTNIYTGGVNNQQNDDFWGVSVRYAKGKCVQTIEIPRSIYYAVNVYMYSLMNEKGGTRSGFKPASEAMILFVNTIMARATGCNMQNQN